MTNPDTSAEAEANPWALDEINARIASGDIDVDPIQTFPQESSMRMEIEALSRDLEAMRAEREEAIKILEGVAIPLAAGFPDEGDTLVRRAKRVADGLEIHSQGTIDLIDRMSDRSKVAEVERDAAIARAEQAEADADSWKTRADLSQAAIAAAMMGAYKEGWSDGAANCHHDRNETPDDGWLISDTYKSIPADAAAALEAVKTQVRDDTVRSAAIAAGNAIVAIAAGADPDISPLRKQMLRVKIEKAVKAALTRDA